MKLRNKRTGDIWEFDEGFSMKASQETAERAGARGSVLTCFASSLANLNAEWEDYEEPKEDEFFKFTPVLLDNRFVVFILDKKASRKEAKKLLAKLKAYKRLKDKGLRFFNNKIIGEYGNVSYRLTYPATTVEEQDLDLLFGGEE